MSAGFSFFINRSFEITDSTGKDLMAIFPEGVAIKILAITLRVAHLTKDTAIGRGDPLHRVDRTVGVIKNVHGGIALIIHILGGDLTVFHQLGKECILADKAAFPMRNGHGHQITHRIFGKPGRLVGGDSGGHQTGLVATDAVKGQSGAFFCGFGDFAIRHKTQL